VEKANLRLRMVEVAGEKTKDADIRDNTGEI